jgi:hypothetical protein
MPESGVAAVLTRQRRLARLAAGLAAFAFGLGALAIAIGPGRHTTYAGASALDAALALGGWRRTDPGRSCQFLFWGLRGVWVILLSSPVSPGLHPSGLAGTTVRPWSAASPCLPLASSFRSC